MVVADERPEAEKELVSTDGVWGGSPRVGL